MLPLSGTARYLCPDAPPPRLARAYGQLIWPGDYVVSITQPAFFRDYLIEQLSLLVRGLRRGASVRVSETEIPYSFVLDAAGPAASRERVRPRSWRAIFPHPRLAQVGDAVVDGLRIERLDGARPLALFDAPRTDYSLKRLEHYTGRAVERRAALDSVHQLSALCRRIRALGRGGVATRSKGWACFRARAGCASRPATRTRS